MPETPANEPNPESWVFKRARCTVDGVMHDLLKMVTSNVNTRNADLGIGANEVESHGSASLSVREVEPRSGRIRVRYVDVAVAVADNTIQIRKSFVNGLWRVDVDWDPAESRCVLRMGTEEVHLEQVSQEVLADLFFAERGVALPEGPSEGPGQVVTDKVD